MKTLTLEISDEKDYEKIMSFVKGLSVKISTAIIQKDTSNNIQDKLNLLDKIGGTIAGKPNISLEALRRENLYGDDAR
jgi:hypothetical protein